MANSINEKIDQIISTARKLLGTPYSYGANSDTEPPTEFDCSSFIQYVFGQHDITLPRSAILQAGEGPGQEISLHENDWRTGDLLFVRGSRGHYRDDLFAGRAIDIGHVAMFIEPADIIHASARTQGVTEEPLANLTDNDKQQIVFVRRPII